MTEPTENPPKESTSYYRVFTTHKKPRPKTTINIARKGSIVKERCKQLSEVALNLFPDRVISDLDLKDLVMLYVGADKETIRSYTGYNGHIRAGKYGENQVVGLARKGYLELLGFMHKIGHGKWLIHSQMTIQEAVNDSHTYRECVGSGFNSEEKISLSPSSAACVEGQASEEVKRVAIYKQINNNTREKERLFTPKISEDDSNLEFLRLLKGAKPLPSPDKGHISWGTLEEGTV